MLPLATLPALSKAHTLKVYLLPGDNPEAVSRELLPDAVGAFSTAVPVVQRGFGGLLPWLNTTL